MAISTLTLPIESKIANRMKKYAEKRKQSVSSIVENFFTLVTASATQNETQEISPLVQSFSINGVDIPVDFDYKKELEAARNEKYL